MKKKIIGILVCTLMIATAFPAVESLKNSVINPTIPSTTSTTGGWIEGQKLHASDAAAGKVFGAPISLDGDTVLIGAVLGDGNAVNSGCAYVFTRSGKTWTQEAKLFASDGATNDQFGCWVSLSGDTALIGAPWDDDKGVDSGSAYVFTRSGTTWTQQAKLLPSDNTAGDSFAYCVSIDGDTALIGAQGDASLVDNGTAYVFTRSGTTWTLEQKLFASDGAAGDCFGFMVSIKGDTALIGADWDDDNGVDSGSAYVFTRSGTTWTQQAKLIASDGVTGDDFSGGGVYLYGDTALIGAYLDDDNGVDSGSAYVFTRSGTTWTQEAKLLPSDGAANDQFSMGAVSLEGDTAFIGAWYNDDNGANSGSAYVFTRSGTTWTQQQKLLASDGAAGDQFGSSVALEGDTAFIGAWFDDDNGANSGSAYVFTKSGENLPPAPPTITGPAKVKPNVKYDYTLNAVDPEGDNVYYYVDWGDGTNTGWVNLSASGVDVIQSHTWTKKGTYTVKAKAKDIYNAESDWTILKVKVPRVISINDLFLQFLQNHPHMFPILRHLIGL
jgi:uncharacterized protein YceK